MDLRPSSYCRLLSSMILRSMAASTASFVSKSDRYSKSNRKPQSARWTTLSRTWVWALTPSDTEILMAMSNPMTASMQKKNPTSM